MDQNIQHLHCGVVKTLKIIGSKWTILILHALCNGTMRFGQLEKTLTGISPKTLSHRLRTLEKEGVIRKKVYAQVPLRIEYSLTAKGISLQEIFDKMDTWGKTQ